MPLCISSLAAVVLNLIFPALGEPQPQPAIVHGWQDHNLPHLPEHAPLWPLRPPAELAQVSQDQQREQEEEARHRNRERGPRRARGGRPAHHQSGQRQSVGRAAHMIISVLN